MPISNDHKNFISRCVQLAKLGGKAVKTNPQVGAVLVHNNKIIGEGFHEIFGGPHAEVNAIKKAIKANEKQIQNSSLYVSLEPCNISAKTGPCTDVILKHKIKHVIVGTMDPNPKVAGKGIEILKKAGIQVKLLNDPSCENLIVPFKHFLKTKMPFVILKFAQSGDFIIGKQNERVLISNKYSQTLTHKWRTAIDGILVGSQTVLTDNPQLTARLYPGDSPKRFILDRSKRMQGDYKVLTDGNDTEVIDSQLGLKSILKGLFNNGIYQLMVEGGRQVLDSFIKEGLWNEARVITNEKVLNTGIKAPQVCWKSYSKLPISFR